MGVRAPLFRVNVRADDLETTKSLPSKPNTICFEGSGCKAPDNLCSIFKEATKRELGHPNRALQASPKRLPIAQNVP